MLRISVSNYALLVSLLWLSVGCTCTVHPILRESDLSTELDLTGTWQPITSTSKNDQLAEDAMKAYRFTAEKFNEGVESDYDVVWNGKDFHGQIGKIGEDFYIQLRRTELNPEIQPLLHAVPVFAIAKVQLTDKNTLEVWTMGMHQIF